MQQQETPSIPSKDLRAYIATVRLHKWTIVLATLLTVAATWFFTTRLTPVYSALTRVRVTPTGTQPVYIQNGGIDMPTERAAAESTVVAETVKKNLHSEDSAESLLGGLDAYVEPETNFLDFAYSDSDAARAQQMANAFANAYLENRRGLANEQSAAQRQNIQDQIASLQQDLQKARSTYAHASPNSPQSLNAFNTIAWDQTTLNSLVNQERQLTALPGAGGLVFQPATRATSPSSPSYPQNIGLAIMIGLALGAGIAFVRDHLDEGLNGTGDLEAQVRAPVLAAIPHLHSWKQRDHTELTVTESPRGPVSEAYRTLRTNLEFVARGGDFKILSVTSPTLGEGKTTTVANLAAMFAQSGRRVIAVSCDLRKPRLHRFFGLTNDVGVTSILTGKATLAEAAQRPATLDSLRVLASGPVPPNPAELLGSHEMQALLDELRLFADFVIIDTPPILAVADALVIGPKSDGVLIVADAHRTSRQGAAHTREQLDQVECNVIGCVFNNFDPAQAKYYPYDSRYYYSSYAYTDSAYSHKEAPTNGNGNGRKEEVSDSKEIWSP